MVNINFSKKLYLVTDSGRYSHAQIAEKAYKAGCNIIQLRYKGTSSYEFFEIASKIRKLMGDDSDLFIVNDRSDVAKAVRAGALHIGEDDLPIEYARAICGDTSAIGVSTHDLETALKAEENGADYIGLGPVFPTKTKELKYEPIGLEMIRIVRKHIKIPIVAISGINFKNARSVIDSGADAVAVSSAICQADDVDREIHLFFKEIEKV
jgi:thiamine-phosphate pyrophosphorylase